MTIKFKKQSGENRDLFTTDDLQIIFSIKHYLDATSKHSFRFWTPLLALFTGARQNEMAQLHLSDFFKQEGIQCIKLSGDTEDKRVKNKESPQLIPLHPFLVDDLRIIDRVNLLKNKGEKRFSPELKLSRDGYGRTVSRWFSEYLKLIGVHVKHKKTFHSFRYTVSNALYQNGMNDHDSNALTGHGEDTVKFSTYVKCGTMPKLHNGLVKYLYFEGLDLSHLKSSKWVIK